MKIYNKSKDIEIHNNINEASTFSDKLLGMLKKSNLGGLIFKTRFGVHTFFLKNPIDVIILDKDYRVVKLATLKPNRFFFWNPKHNYVLELPEGTIKRTKIEAGNFLKGSPY